MATSIRWTPRLLGRSIRGSKGGEEAAGMVYVPYNAEGMIFGEPYKKCGFCMTDENVDIWYENVKVPARYRVDIKPGDGSKIVHGYVISLGRLAGAAWLTGIATSVLEIALEWTKDRMIAGKPVREIIVCFNNCSNV